MNKNIKILINYLLGPLLFLVLSWSLYRQIMHQQDLAIRWAQIKEGWHTPLFWLVIVLMLVNWGIESRKWQLLVNHVQQFSFGKAVKSVLSGCSVTMLTPNRIGEYGGRILYVAEGNRLKAISLTIVGSISQLLITMVMGCMGLIYLRFFSHNGLSALSILPVFWDDVLIFLSFICTGILLLFYLRLGWLVRIMEKINAFQKVVTHIKVLDEFHNKQLIHLLALSFIRYLVFVLQYMLLLHIMQVEVPPILCFWLMSVFYLVMAMAPTFGFIELPVRISASWFIFKFTGNELGVGTAALSIWLINLVLPAIIGSLLILSIKILKIK